MWLPYSIVVVSLCTNGCSIFSPSRGSQTDYAAAKRSIENPVGVGGEPYGDGTFRPEGVSAEREGVTSDFFERIGLRAKRRRDVDLAQSLYGQADAAFEAAKTLEGEARAEAFRKAAGLYKDAAKNWQSSGLEQDALLMQAESHFFAEDYYRAELVFSELVKEYPRNPYLDHVGSRRFEIADYWLKSDAHQHKPFVVLNVSDPKKPWNDTGGHGMRVLERIRIDDPTGKVSDDTTMRIAVEQYEKGKFEEAAMTFEDLRMTYPDSEHQFNAQFLEMQSLLASYQGPTYSSVPLTDAHKRVLQIVKQFPKEAEEHQQEINQAYSKIRFQMAERVWEQAEYRRKRSENSSAKFHYNRILEEYGDTPFAERAQTGLDAIQGEPSDPPQRFQSLLWIFGDTPDDGRPWREMPQSAE
ncbi:Outer membrane protein assembly factor BamD [Aureliella helgolandensis]|uniref:Outer membrane protein assembly factor BamD n=2 Tax=Aureliella helgolandensis TaxID=2527968 RepID=A0A518FZL5_9BACT|nr:Outer membrane protein assembly factor BamD [Aureliella helgolandensis]